MPAHKAPFDLFSDAIRLPDPGDAGTITADRNPCYVPLTSAGAETRTVAVPTRGGVTLKIGGRVVAGTITITFTSGMDEDDTTSFSITEAGQFIILESFEVAADTFRWRKIADHGTGLLSPTEIGYLEDVTAGTAAASKAVVLGALQAISFAAAATPVTIIANTAAAVSVTDGTTTVLNVDTRNTVKDVHTLTVTGVAVTVASEAAAHINASLRIAAKTITYTGTTGTTSSLGAMLSIAAPTFTDASMMTLTTASSVHITAVAAAGGMLTISNSRMISTSVSDCYLTNAGVWTDTACWESGKELVNRAKDQTFAAVERLLDRLMPAIWKYKPETALDSIEEDGSIGVHRTPINDRGRERVGIVYDDLPDELRAPGEEKAVAPSILASFALAAAKVLLDRNRDLEARLARLEAA